MAQTTNRFYQPNVFDGTPGPAPGAASDGLTPGSTYTAVIQSAISKGLTGIEGPKDFVQVSIPALHLSETFLAHIQPNTPAVVGETGLVIFDDQKIPWVVQGTWEADFIGKESIIAEKIKLLAITNALIAKETLTNEKLSAPLKKGIGERESGA